MIPVKDVLVERAARIRTEQKCRRQDPVPFSSNLRNLWNLRFQLRNSGSDRSRPRFNPSQRTGQIEEGSLLNFEAIAGMTNVYCFCHVNRFFRDVFDSVGDTFGAL